MGDYSKVYVRKCDLEANSSKIIEGACSHWDEDVKRAYNTLDDALTWAVTKSKTIKFPELEIICLNDDDMNNLTSRNHNVRDLLDELKIFYVVEPYS